MVTSSALTVTQLNTYIKMMFESDSRLKRICVVGEISNFTNHYKTGHLYFSVKDNTSSIKAVMFARSAALLKFRPENGMRVYITGRVSVFDRDGVYQIYADSMEPEGAGALMLAFEQLKEKLTKEGLFDEFNKKPIPEFPRKIAVVTSSAGAALHDVINVISRRFPLAELLLCGVAVQGVNCPKENINALKMLNDRGDVDVIILCRGGGSAEDLWGYNDERLVRAVAASRIPIITGIGHETDFTLCDFASDMRAPTPSAAAEIAVPDIEELYQINDSLSFRLYNAINMYIDSLYEKYGYLASKLPNLDPKRTVVEKENNLNTVNIRLDSAIKTYMGARTTEFGIFEEKLKLLNPIRLLSNGYAVAYADGKRIRGVSEMRESDMIDVRFADGNAICEVKKITITENI